MLDAERVATLRFKGENGLMRKKFSALNKDIELQHEEIKAMLDKERKLHSHISVLKREIKGLREIVQDRDVEIGKKEKLIYDMKKKNQELEKFKFVLDFKIKELKRQIEPRENEIKDLKDKIRGRDAELERYHNSNASLDKSIGELRLRLNTLQRNVLANRTQLGVKRKYINSFRCDLHKVATQAHEMETLKSSVIEIYKKYVNSSKEDVDTKMMDENVQKECERQRSYMKKSICKLKRNIASEAESQKSENRKHIKENMELINEIADLRKKIKGVKFGVRGDVFDEVCLFCFFRFLSIKPTLKHTPARVGTTRDVDNVGKR
jgi:cilia- and flagella-associated protein 57